ncbi:class I SAM-dependent RNA methyltransferase [Arthrobacter sp. UM1]|uniref:class I SAM-dependent RNA methyltransferase n=1 Tax=Arthrobacter sp. UM1 TaxID=2766776 RepID=UPI001CF6C643|nr:TRAM domain-containing protein [Arthrobacter sp. UM1]MCB4207653.1 class I SAM-dependent RNA methyltransferase [Arthrobacter sp. UM1]
MSAGTQDPAGGRAEEPAAGERVGDVLDLDVGAPANGGAHVARRGPGEKVVFVSGALEGERVRARITRAQPKESFVRARVVEVLEPSPARRKHPWPVADPLEAPGGIAVGGAELGHAAPAEQRRIKATAANDALVRLGRFREEGLAQAGLLPKEAREVPVPSGSEGWRTRIALAVGRDGRLGMHPSGTREVLSLEDMPLAVDALRIPGLFRTDFTGLERVELAAGSDQVLVLLVERAARRPQRGQGRRGARPAGHRRLSPQRWTELAEAAAAAVREHQASRGQSGAADAAEPQGVSVAAWSPTTGELTPLIGRAELRQDVVHGGVRRSYRVTGDGFWQIHEGAPQALADAAMELLDPRPGERIADLYAGAGLFTGAVLETVSARGGLCGSLLSVEAYPVTSADAAANTPGDRTEEGVGVRVRASKVEDALHGERLDALVLDPSRAGAGASAVRAIAATGAARVVYISCDAASFARDARLLADEGYDLVRRELFDIYPDTHHVETAALFQRESEG